MAEFSENINEYRTKMNIDLTEFYTIETPPSSSTSKDSLDELSLTSPNKSQFQFNNRSSHSGFFSTLNEKSKENNQVGYWSFSFDLIKIFLFVLIRLTKENVVESFSFGNERRVRERKKSLFSFCYEFIDKFRKEKYENSQRNVFIFMKFSFNLDKKRFFCLFYFCVSVWRWTLLMRFFRHSLRK